MNEDERVHQLLLELIALLDEDWRKNDYERRVAMGQRLRQSIKEKKNAQQPLNGETV